MQRFVSVTNVKIEMGQMKSCQKGALESPAPNPTLIKKTVWTFPSCKDLGCSALPHSLHPAFIGELGQVWGRGEFTDSAGLVPSGTDSSTDPGHLCRLRIALCRCFSLPPGAPGIYQFPSFPSRAPPARGITELPCPESHGRKRMYQAVFSSSALLPSLGIITGCKKRRWGREMRSGSLAPEEWLDGCQVLLYSIPAAVGGGRRTLYLAGPSERSSLWQLI